MSEKDGLLRVEDFASRLYIKPSTARAWVLRRRIAKVRLGSRAIRIPASEVSRLITEGLIPARPRQRS